MTTSSVTTIDCDYLCPRYAAAYLLRADSGERDAVFIENNTAHSVPKLLSALTRSGAKPSDVRYAIITHVHLDHAGGSSKRMDACPNATLLAHPRAAPHVIDPSRLVASARQVYGDARFVELYGEIQPIPASRVRVMQDREKLSLGSRTLTFFHTRGHANHHFCVHDSGSDGVFTGDSFGLAYPDLQTRGLFVFPSTSPTDFDAPEARLSIRKIVETGAKRAWLTHFGEVTDLKAAASQLNAHLDFCEALLERAVRAPLADDELDGLCQSEWRRNLETAFARQGITATPGIWEMLALDIDLNGAGIAHVARKKRKAGA